MPPTFFKLPNLGKRWRSYEAEAAGGDVPEVQGPRPGRVSRHGELKPVGCNTVSEGLVKKSAAL